MKLGQIHTTITIFNILLFSFLFIAFSDLKLLFIQEDNFIENLSAILFFLSFFVGLITLIRFKKPHFHPIYIGIPVLGLIGFLDEISFGERIAGFKSPELYGAKIASFHDAVDSIDHVLYRSIKYGDYLLLFLLLAILLATLFGIVQLIRRYRKNLRLNKILTFSEKHPPFRFLLISLGFIFIAMMIDFDIIGDHRAATFMFVEEIFEMNAALTFLFGALAIGIRQQSPTIRKHLVKL
ncbi:MAG: hypothetical protein QNJ46_02995 [Leptolyngbyaceae cyanobacterium MO_188.B28]|nr:hypothetical protein [Leptolyngbyaceae cyanobacterium MO_188.B28]